MTFLLLYVKSPQEALSHPGWRQTMIDEMTALESNQTWTLVPPPSGKSIVGCRWVYTVKVGPDGKIDRLKARLVAKGYTQVFGLDYSDTFSPVAKMASVRLFLSMAAMRHWPLYQLDIKNAFLHGDLEEEVYLEQPPGFVAQRECRGYVCRLHKALYGLKQSPRAWFGRFSNVVQQYGMIRSEADHSVFYKRSSNKYIYLVVYFDDIVITGDDHDGIAGLKHRHIIETARTLLINANVPLKFWGDAVLTAGYLINRMPSSAIQNKVPHSILFPDEPLFRIAPRVFGSTCFVHDLTPGLDKLCARAIKCVFLGYSRVQKGYRCYCPSTHRFYMSADVTFFEDTPFFASSIEPESISQVLPIPFLVPVIPPTPVIDQSTPSSSTEPPSPPPPQQ